jgi:hypothetical protein
MEGGDLTNLQYKQRLRSSGAWRQPTSLNLVRLT